MMGSNRKNLFFYQRIYRTDNLGDWLIGKALLTALASRGDLICSDPHLLNYHIPGLMVCRGKRDLIGKIMAGILERRKLWAVKPPGHLFVVRNSLRKMLAWGLRILNVAALRILGIRTIQIGISIGPLPSKIRSMEKILAYCMSCYTVRESSSMNYVKEVIGISSAVQFPDLSILAFDSAKSWNQSRQFAAISMREQVAGKFPDEVYARDKITPACVAAMTACTDTPSSLMVAVAYQVDHDAELGEYLRHRLASLNPHFIDTPLNYGEAVELYGNTEIIVSNRLHVLLMGMLSGAVPVALIDPEVHFKVKAVLSDAGLAELIVNIKQPSELIYDQVRSICLRAGTLRSKIRDYFIVQKTFAEKELNKLLGVAG